MTMQESRDRLISDLEMAVNDALAYFDRHGRMTRARIDDWGSWEILAHFAYWHAATAWGIASAIRGGPPWQLPGTAYEINATSLRLYAGESFDDLSGLLRDAQNRLVHIAHAATDLDAPAFRNSEGKLISVAERLETIARHWRSHVNELRNAG
jgi:hypothetical protein